MSGTRFCLRGTRLHGDSGGSYRLEESQPHGTAARRHGLERPTSIDQFECEFNAAQFAAQLVEVDPRVIWRERLQSVVQVAAVYEDHYTAHY
jgi:hypothetical protein